jgi:S1-C subfamily serine protease
MAANGLFLSWMAENPLENTFEIVRSSIVAFASRVVRRERPQFPEIIGTGFVVDARGVVATNRHVIDALKALPRHPSRNESSAFCILPTSIQSSGDQRYMGTLFVGIRGYNVLESFVPAGSYYGQALPDFGFIQLEVQQLPALQLSEDAFSLRVGMPIATAGFPLGTDALLIYENISQVMPFLRHGIVSSVLPFPCPNPHGFTIDVMAQGGASGSPIFLPERPLAVGILHAGFEGTNITFGVPSTIVAKGLEECLKSSPLDLVGVPTFADLVARSERNDILTWEPFRTGT